MADNLYFSRDTKIFAGISEVRRIQITAGGSGYTGIPDVVISGGGGAGATATAVVNGSGVVSNILITNKGKNYTSTPTITIGGVTAAGGSGATARTGCGVWELPVVDGFSFSQATNTSEITLNEAVSSGGISRRGRQMFTDSFAPAEWSFSTYARPFKSSGGGKDVGDADRSAVRTHAVEEVLWASMVGGARYLAPRSDAGASTYTTTAFTDGMTYLTQAGLGYTGGDGSPQSRLFIDFDDSNKTELATLDLYFSLGEENVEEHTIVFPTITGDSQIPKAAIEGENTVNGKIYEITSPGNTNFTNFGAADSNAGTIFTKSGGTIPGTGKVREVGLANGVQYVIANLGLAAGVTNAVDWNSIATESLTNSAVKVGDIFTAGTGKSIPTNSEATVVLRAGIDNQRLYLPSVERLQVGDKIVFTVPTGFSAIGDATITSLTPNTSLSYLDTVGVHMNVGRSVPAGTVVRIGRRLTYKLEGCCVNEASIDFDIDGIATINWSGLGQMLKEDVPVKPTIFEATTSTSNFIRNRLSTLQLVADNKTAFPGHSGSDGVYNITLTGGNITISNNMTYLTPESLGQVNLPLGHVTGTRSVSGNFTCYMTRDDGATPTTGTSASLFEKLIESTDIVTNKFAMRVNMGGDYSATDLKPILSLDMDQVHLELPTHSLDDVISLEVNFHGLPSTVDETDELTLTYLGL